MSSMTELRVLHAGTAPTGISRRDLAKALLAAVAAGTVLSFSSTAHPVYKHLLSGTLLDSADVHLSSATSEPLFLSAEQLNALDILGQAIVPGARQARAAVYIDLLLSADSPEVQRRFLASLAQFASHSQQKHHAQIDALTPVQLNDLLIEWSAPEFAQHADFNHLKDWIVGAYYSSEIGMRELGWTPDRVFTAFPGCTDSDTHR